MDNLHVVVKDINIRIEEPNNDNTTYSLGLTLKELLVINTNEQWEQHFIDRNVDKTADYYKMIRVSNLGIYLQVNEKNFISNNKTVNECYKEMQLLFPKEATKAKGVTYLMNPMSISIKMKKLNEDNKLTSTALITDNTQQQHDEALVNLFIDLPTFTMEIKKEQFKCIIFILNHISKYQKYQNNYYDTKKFNYFKPKYRVLDSYKQGICKDKPHIKNENAFLWLKFEFEMVYKQIQYYKGNKSVFQIPKSKLMEYEILYNDLFKRYYTNKRVKPDYIFDNENDKETFKEIVYKVDIKLLEQWTKPIVEGIFKSEKIEEKKYAATLLAKGVPADKIYKYGFAFEGKNVLIEQG